MRAAVIINPHAGAVRRRPQLADRLRAVCGPRADLCLTESDERLREVAARFAREHVEHIGIVGGDGTASTTLTRIWQAYAEADRPLPRIALLRGGTMNTIANSLGVSRRSPAQLLRRALATNGSTPGIRSRPTLRVGERLGFLFGTGLMYGYLAEYYAVGQGQPTPITAAAVLARATASALTRGRTFQRILCATELSVRYDGGSWEPRTYLTVGAGTIAHAGLGFQPFYRAFDHQDRFHLLAVKGKPAEVALDLPGVWLGRGMRPRVAYETTASWAELASDQPTFGYYVDGDLMTAQGSLSLRVGPSFDILRI